MSVGVLPEKSTASMLCADPLLAARAANLAIDACTHRKDWATLCLQRMMVTGMLLGPLSGWNPIFGGMMIEARDGGAPFGCDPEYVESKGSKYTPIHAWLARVEGAPTPTRVEMLDPSAGYFQLVSESLGIPPLHPLPEGPFYWAGAIEDAGGDKLHRGIIWRTVPGLKLPPLGEIKESVREFVAYARVLLMGSEIVSPNGRFSLR